MGLGFSYSAPEGFRIAPGLFFSKWSTPYGSDSEEAKVAYDSSTGRITAEIKDPREGVYRISIGFTLSRTDEFAEGEKPRSIFRSTSLDVGKDRDDEVGISSFRVRDATKLRSVRIGARVEISVKEKTGHRPVKPENIISVASTPEAMPRPDGMDWVYDNPRAVFGPHTVRHRAHGQTDPRSPLTSQISGRLLPHVLSSVFLNPVPDIATLLRRLETASLLKARARLRLCQERRWGRESTLTS